MAGLAHVSHTCGTNWQSGATYRSVPTRGYAGTLVRWYDGTMVHQYANTQLCHTDAVKAGSLGTRVRGVRRVSTGLTILAGKNPVISPYGDTHPIQLIPPVSPYPTISRLSLGVLGGLAHMRCVMDEYQCKRGQHRYQSRLSTPVAQLRQPVPPIMAHH